MNNAFPGHIGKKESFNALKSEVRSRTVYVAQYKSENNISTTAKYVLTWMCVRVEIWHARCLNCECKCASLLP